MPWGGRGKRKASSERLSLWRGGKAYGRLGAKWGRELFGRATQYLKAHWLKVTFRLVVFLGALATLLPFVGVDPFAASGSGGPPYLSIEGKVRTLPGDDQWLDRAQSAPGRVNEYSVEVRNSGLGPAHDLVVRMALPIGIQLIRDSCRVSWEEEQECAGDLGDGGLEFEQLDGQQEIVVSFRGRVEGDAPEHGLRSQVILDSNETGELHDDMLVELPISEAATEVRGLYASQLENVTEFWLGDPTMARRSKRLLIKRWDDLGYNRVHAFDSRPGGAEVGIAELFNERGYDGRVVQPWGYVLSVSLTQPIRGKPWLVRQSFEVDREGTTAAVWCFAARPRSRRIEYGDRVWVRGVPIAWGSATEQGGRFEWTTMMVCTAVRRF